MGLQVGNLLGAVSGISTALSKEKTVKGFLAAVNSFGIQVKNNFEVNFSGLADITFFLTNIDIPQVEQTFTEVSYNGRSVEIPVIYDYSHDFNITVLNDAQGYIYSAIHDFIMTDVSNQMVNSGYTMTIKALTGDEKYAGMMLTLNNVRMASVTGLQFGYSDDDVSTFDVGLKLQTYTVSPGALGTIANVTGALNSLIS